MHQVMQKYNPEFSRAFWWKCKIIPTVRSLSSEILCVPYVLPAGLPTIFKLLSNLRRFTRTFAAFRVLWAIHWPIITALRWADDAIVNIFNSDSPFSMLCSLLFLKWHEELLLPVHWTIIYFSTPVYRLVSILILIPQKINLIFMSPGGANGCCYKNVRSCPWYWCNRWLEVSLKSGLCIGSYCEGGKLKAHRKKKCILYYSNYTP